MKDFKYKKQLFLGISLALLICALVCVIIFLGSNNRTTSVSSNTVESSFTPDVTLENTSDDVSDIKEEDVPEIVTEEKASEEELKKEKVTKKEVKKATSPYYIKVNYGANVVTIYKKDKDGKYTVPFKAMVCSCGTYTPTSGTYKISSKYRWGKLIHDVYGQYATRIVGSILFHSVPYSSNKNDTLLYNQYDKLGTTASAGCVRLTVRDAKWIYSNCPSGTMVEFYSNSNPGPLGKPSAQKISSVEECRNWDPTDPAEGNPWHTYKENEEKEEENNSTSNSITNNTNTTNSITNNVISNNITNSSNSSNNISNNLTNNTVNNNITNNSVNNATNNNSTISNSINNTISTNTSNNTIIKNNTTNNAVIQNNTTSSSNNKVSNSNSNLSINNALTNQVNL